MDIHEQGKREFDPKPVIGGQWSSAKPGTLLLDPLNAFDGRLGSCVTPIDFGFWLVPATAVLEAFLAMPAPATEDQICNARMIDREGARGP